MSCSRCQKLPELLFLNSDVYVSIPTNHHREGFENVLKEKGYRYSEVEGGYQILQVEFEGFISFLATEVFNSVEKKDVHILPLRAGEALSFSSLKNYRSLLAWERVQEGKEITSIISEGRIRTLFQPIIEAKTGEIYGYEALSRGIKKDGTIMNPGKLFSGAKDMDLLFNLDRTCREASIRAASKQGITKKLFINFIPTAIYEPALCLQSTARVLNEENFDAKQVVFEVVETEKVEDFGHLNRILDYYREKGYSTALDDIGSGYSDVDALLQLKPDYMKIDMEIIRDIHKEEAKQRQLDEYIRNGRKIGLRILAEGVEKKEEYAYLLSKEVDLLQGYLFGKPEEVPKKDLDFSFTV